MTKQCWPRPSKELDLWIKHYLRELGFRSRPGKPSERLGPFKILWYWWRPKETQP